MRSKVDGFTEEQHLKIRAQLTGVVMSDLKVDDHKNKGKQKQQCTKTLVERCMLHVAL